MYRIRDIISALEAEAPFAFQEEYDNSGIQLGNQEAAVSRALVCLDITPEVLSEAIEKSCDLIISHHPLIFKGLKKITGEHYTEEVIIGAVKNDISVISAHTNLDNAWSGVNRKLAGKLGLVKSRILSPMQAKLRKLVTFVPSEHAEAVRQAMFEAGAGHIGEYDSCSFNLTGTGTFRAGEKADPFVGKTGSLHRETEVRIEVICLDHQAGSILKALQEAHPYEEVAWDLYLLDNKFERAGSGLVGFLPEPMPVPDFLDLLSDTLHVPCLRYTDFSSKPIEKVALCGGSGGFLLPRAMAAGADAFVSSEFKYNQFMDAQNKLLLVDAGHYETEQFAKELIVDIIKKKLRNFALLISETQTNPVRYHLKKQIKNATK